MNICKRGKVAKICKLIAFQCQEAEQEEEAAVDAASRDMKSSRVQILHISARNFGNFPELRLNSEPTQQAFARVQVCETSKVQAY